MAVDARIEELKSLLPNVESIPSSDPERSHYLRELTVIYTLCFCATLQLHLRFGPVWDIDNSKALAAATAATSFVENIDITSLVYIDPIMGVSATELCLDHTILTAYV